jgi:predicted lipoprotein with Yx(FWY)xxD motif
VRRRLGADRHHRLGGRTAAVVLTGLVVLVMAGCTRPGTAITNPYVTTPPHLENGPVYEVKVGQVAGLGAVLVDGQGLTLYLYSTDRQGSPSRCYSICAIQWPPLVLPAGVSRPIAGPGIQSTLLSTAPRSDGTRQITYNGWPLYLWPPDRAPGKATGQALTNAGGLWYVLDPAGNEVHTSSVA